MIVPENHALLPKAYGHFNKIIFPLLLASRDAAPLAKTPQRAT